MQTQCCGLRSWLSLGLLAGVGIAAIFLIGPSTPEAQADPLSPKGTAAFQTTEKLVVSVPLPDRKQGGTLSVELIDAKKEVLQTREQKVAAGKAVSTSPANSTTKT